LKYRYLQTIGNGIIDHLHGAFDWLTDVTWSISNCYFGC
jgi:hypothetical protein